MIFSTTAFCQQTKTVTAQLTKTDYLKKGKNQKTAAWLLLGGGATVSLIGIAVEVNSANNALIDLFTLQPTTSSSSSGGVLFFTGGAAMLGSIPLFIASSRNKRKGMALSFKNVKMPQINNTSLVYRRVPSLSLTFKL